MKTSMKQIFTVGAVIFFSLHSCSLTTNSKKSELRKADLAQINPALFTLEEWHIPYYLEHFHKVANSVVMEGDNRGFLNLSTWRGNQNHHTYNARIMEGILSLVWFYVTDRPWNAYYKDENLKHRIEAALDFWCSIQSEDGRFSEYAENRWSLAPSAFATKFVGYALLLLDKGPQIDQDIYNKSRKVLRKTLVNGLSNDRFWKTGMNLSNQYSNFWAGGLTFLAVEEDAEVRRILEGRMKESLNSFQSPAGFFYELGGPDWQYNLSTHHSNLHVAWEFGTPEIRQLIIEKTKRWYEWFSYNALLEPGTMTYYLNRAIETRQQKVFYKSDSLSDPASQRWAPQTEFVPVAHAFKISDEELASAKAFLNQKMLDAYPDVPELEVGEFRAFSPYAFLHQELGNWHPSYEQKKESIENLPYMKEENFIHQRYDPRSNTKYLYIKTPYYYATFNEGDIITDQQRMGLGLIWNKNMGTIFQSQSRTNEAAWGTILADSSNVLEAKNLHAEIIYNNKSFTNVRENNSWPASDLTIAYALDDQANKQLKFQEQSIEVSVNKRGNFVEVLPLLIGKKDNLKISGNKIIISSGAQKCEITVDDFLSIEESTFASDSGIKKIRVVRVNARDRLKYSIKLF